MSTQPSNAVKGFLVFSFHCLHECRPGDLQAHVFSSTRYSFVTIVVSPIAALAFDDMLFVDISLTPF